MLPRILLDNIRNEKCLDRIVVLGLQSSHRIITEAALRIRHEHALDEARNRVGRRKVCYHITQHDARGRCITDLSLAWFQCLDVRTMSHRHHNIITNNFEIQQRWIGCVRICTLYHRFQFCCIQRVAMDIEYNIGRRRDLTRILWFDRAKRCRNLF